MAPPAQGNDSKVVPPPAIQCLLFDAGGDDREVDVADLATLEPAENQLLWVDVRGSAVERVRELIATLGFPDAIGAGMTSGATHPALRNHGRHFELRVIAISTHDDLRFTGDVLSIAAGRNRVITVHSTAIPFLDALRRRERGETQLGLLDATLFVAALLDWLLGTYFDAVSAFERAVDEMETGILEDRDPQLENLRDLRRSASRLREMLGPHRRVFAALQRPDFRPEDAAAEAQFVMLDAHFERAMDMVEHARGLVVGSFEMLSTRMALRTNDSMRALTFATVVIGVLAVLAGVLGMNFEAPFFQSGERGFWVSVTVMSVVLAVSVIVGKRGDWF